GGSPNGNGGCSRSWPPRGSTPGVSPTSHRGADREGSSADSQLPDRTGARPSADYQSETDAARGGRAGAKRRHALPDLLRGLGPVVTPRAPAAARVGRAGEGPPR